MRDTTYSQPLMVRLSPVLLSNAKDVAKGEGVSMSEFVRTALRYQIKQAQNTQSREC